MRARTVAPAPLAVEAVLAVDRATRSLTLDGAFARLRSGQLDAYESMFASEDAAEGPRAFTEGRDSHWQGR